MRSGPCGNCAHMLAPWRLPQSSAYRPSIMVLLPDILRSLGLKEDHGGALLSIAGLAYTVGKPTGQILSDFLDPHRGLWAAVVSSGLAFGCLGIARNFTQMAFVVAILHLAQGLVTPCCVRLIANV